MDSWGRVVATLLEVAGVRVMIMSMSFKTYITDYIAQERGKDERDHRTARQLLWAGEGCVSVCETS